MKIFKFTIYGFLVLGITFTVIAFIYGMKIEDVLAYFNDDAAYELVETDPITTQLEEITVQTQIRIIEINYTNDIELTYQYHQREGEIWEIEITDTSLTISQREPLRLLSGLRHASLKVRTIQINIPITWNLTLDIKTTTGSISIEGTSSIEVPNLKAHATTGSIRLKNITTNNLEVKTSTGSVNIENVSADTADLRTSTGTVRIKNSNLDQLNVKVSTGDIRVEGLVFESVTLQASTGDIRITDISIENTTLQFNTNTGHIRLNEQTVSKDYSVVFGGNKQLTLKTNTGNITVKTRN